MALQSSGRISLKQIATEYTDTAPHNMSEFYNGGSAGVSSNLIPSSGAIYFSDFYGATASTAVDSSAETAFLMKASGNSATNADITYQNSSDVSTGFTETGDPQASTFSPYRSGGYSVYFDGTGDAINVPSSGFPAIGTSDFTIEAWVYANSLSSNMAIFDGRPSGTSGGNYITLQWHASTYGMGFYSGGWRIQSPTNTLTLNTWHHIALSRSGSSTKLFVDGTQVGSTYSDTTNYLYGRNYIGGLYNNTNTWWNGYMRDFRVSIGTARYTSNFTPNTEALTADVNTDVLVCHLPYFKDGSTNDATLTIDGNTHTIPFGPYDYSAWAADDVGGSVYFDNNAGDRILTSATSAIGTSDFTIEAWVYPNSFSSQEPIICCADGTTGDSTNWQMNLDANGDLVFRYNGSTSVTTTAGTVLNTWNHVAVTATGGTIYLWVNGKTDTNVTYTHNYTDARIKIGVNRSHAQTFDGYIADARVIIGTAQYTSAFTPPTAPLSHTGSQTTLLMNNKSDANIYDASAANGLIITGDVASSTSQRKFTTSSSFLINGDGDRRIEIPGNRELVSHFGSGDFTIEGWVYFTAFSNPGYVLSGNSNSGYGWFIAEYSGVLKMYASTVNNSWDLVSNKEFGTCTVNTWHHFAAVRDGTNVKLFLDGVLGSTTAVSTSSFYADASDLSIGSRGTQTVYNMTGYLQDLRITKGTARYTAAFTPPTAEFEL